MGFLPQLSAMFCNLLWREYGNATKSLGLVLPFFRLSHSEDPGTYAKALPSLSPGLQKLGPSTGCTSCLPPHGLGVPWSTGE